MRRFFRNTVWLFVTIVSTGFLTQSSYGQAGKSLIINHFVVDPDVIEGHLVVSDVTGKGGRVDIWFYDQNGVLAGKTSQIIPAHGKINLDPQQYVQQKKLIGTIRMDSREVITGQYWQFYKDPALGWKNIAVPAAIAPGATKLVCQHFVSDPTIESYIVVADAEGTSPTLYVEFYSDQGELAGQKRYVIPRNGKLSILPIEAVGGKKMTGVAYIQTEGGKITGEYWQVSPGEKYQVAHAMLGSAPEAEVMAEETLLRIQINFDFDSDKIQKRSYADLAEVAKAMNDPRNKSYKYEIAGYTDDVGKRSYNIKLSERRARSVMKHLISKCGVDAHRLVSVGYGPDNPLVPNTSEANRARNRRVEFKRLSK